MEGKNVFEITIRAVGASILCQSGLPCDLTGCFGCWTRLSKVDAGETGACLGDAGLLICSEKKQYLSIRNVCVNGFALRIRQRLETDSWCLWRINRPQWAHSFHAIARACLDSMMSHTHTKWSARICFVYETIINTEWTVGEDLPTSTGLDIDFGCQ